jgi:DNA-binding LytR/AlgR family response regulator
MLHIAVCDDNIEELSNMVQLINLYRTSKNFNCEYAIFPNGFDLLSVLEKGKRFDIYCLDIIMPGFTGIDVAREIRAFDKTACSYSSCCFYSSVFKTLMAYFVY